MTAWDERDRRLALAVRDACIAEALAAHQQAGISGLCQEGRWELAVDRLRQLDADRLLAAWEQREVR